MKVGDIVTAKEYAIPLWWEKKVGIIVEQREYSPAFLVQWSSGKAEYCIGHEIEVKHEGR